MIKRAKFLITFYYNQKKEIILMTLPYKIEELRISLNQDFSSTLNKEYHLYFREGDLHYREAINQLGKLYPTQSLRIITIIPNDYIRESI